MLHQCQGLTLRLEPGHDLLGVHPQLDDLERNLAGDRLGLLSHEHQPESTFPDLLEDLVTAYHRARTFHQRNLGHGGVPVAIAATDRLEDLLRGRGGLEQTLHVPAQIGVAPAGFGQVNLSLVRIQLESGMENTLKPGLALVHGHVQSSYCSTTRKRSAKSDR